MRRGRCPVELAYVRECWKYKALTGRDKFGDKKGDDDV